ncbi:DUF1150 family protein [Algihabitans albus]|uniref:DUF1150 family protein n=1 Tax=Algihabitans albus TaxID=2164067 RepID=UPI000E5D3043|nr:DUF1150 family protein [Algihabitans albus]
MVQINLESVRGFSQQDLQAFGVDDLAYVKPAITSEGQIVFVVHAANGQVMGSLPSRDSAFAALLQQGLTPLSVH